MKTQIEKQKEAVARMKQSPCQCLEYHPKVGTDIYNQYLKEWQERRNLSNKAKGSVDKNWIMVWLLASQSCPYIREAEAKVNKRNNKWTAETACLKTGESK